MKTALFWGDVTEISGSCKEFLSVLVTSVLWEKLRVSEGCPNFSSQSIGPKPHLLRSLYSITTSEHRIVLGLGNREAPLLSFSRSDFKSLLT